ncbi:MAG: type VI secretion system amidase immunity protein Tai4 [Azoarcus sp.]|nr:type VI secretion system amidase immunity protein Tai4 [Azoarcus sp.]
MKKTILILAMLISGNVYATSPNIPAELLGSRIATYSARGLLKNWALSTCFARISKNIENKNDAIETATAFAKFGQISLEEQNTMQPLIDKFISKKYSGHETKSEFHTMKCIDIVISDEFERLVTRLLEARQNSLENIATIGYPDNSGPWNYTQRDITKNYAFSACFAEIAKDNDTRTDAGSCIYGYFQFGILDIDDYSILRKISQSFIKRKYGGKNPTKYNTMKCIDLYYSPELETLVTKLLSKEKEKLRETNDNF